MNISVPYNAFIIEQKIKGNSDNTLKYYGYCINPLIGHLGVDFEIENLTIQHLKQYVFILQNKNIASNTVKSYVKGLKVFLSWLYKEQYIQDDLSVKIPLPKAEKKVVNVLTDSEIKRLFSSFNIKTFLGIRNYCICALMLDSGLRKNEIVNLQITDLHIAENYAIVTGKGNKQRIVPLGLKSQKYLIKYLAMRPHSINCKQLFLTQSFTPIRQGTIDKEFKKLKKVFFTRRIYPHLLRHTFATRYLENGGNIYALQQILGHTTLDMVKKYVHLTQSKSVVYFSTFSPLDNIS